MLLSLLILLSLWGGAKVKKGLNESLLDLSLPFAT